MAQGHTLPEALLHVKHIRTLAIVQEQGMIADRQGISGLLTSILGDKPKRNRTVHRRCGHFDERIYITTPLRRT